MWVECSEIIGRCLIGKHNLPRFPPHTLPKCNLPSFAPSCTFTVPQIDYHAEFIFQCCHSNPIEKEAIIANPPCSCQFHPAAQKSNFRHILPRNICEKDNFPIIFASAVVSAPAADNAAIMCCWLFPEVHYPLPVQGSASCAKILGSHSLGHVSHISRPFSAIPYAEEQHRSCCMPPSGFYESHEWLYLCTPLRLTGHGAAYHCLP